MKHVPENLKNLEEKIHDLYEKEHEVVHHTQISPYADAAKIGFSITIELISGVLIGAGLGYFLDLLFLTEPIFMVLLLLLGGAASFVNVYNMVKAEEKRSMEHKE